MIFSIADCQSFLVIEVGMLFILMACKCKPVARAQPVAPCQCIRFQPLCFTLRLLECGSGTSLGGTSRRRCITVASRE
jgi:hypothetical protein